MYLDVYFGKGEMLIMIELCESKLRKQHPSHLPTCLNVELFNISMYLEMFHQSMGKKNTKALQHTMELTKPVTLQ